MTDWLQTLRQIGSRGLDAVLVTVLSGKGSTPRDAGAKMVVAVDGVHGTIGGGELEFQALDIARGMLRTHGERTTKRFPLGATLGQVCGGAANLLFERVPSGAEWVRVAAERHEAGEPCVVVTPTGERDEGHLVATANAAWGTLGTDARDGRAIAAARKRLAAAEPAPQPVALDDEMSAVFEVLRPLDFHVVLFGAGHVGRALVRVLGTLPCRVTWVDGRAEEFPAELPGNVRTRLTDAPLAEVGSAAPGSFFLVMTHSHALDFELVEAILRRGDFAYCGMIGSATKRKTFDNGLAKHGVPPPLLARFTCPIGIPGIKGKEPAAIAIAVAAELLQLRSRGAAGRQPVEAARA
jgi:xanthine dehydrogenase accessory factor